MMDKNMLALSLLLRDEEERRCKGIGIVLNTVSE